MKKFTRFFTVADYIEEEKWLREQSKKGLKLAKLFPPVRFHFEETEPEDVVYKLDYKNSKASAEMKRMYEDYGWEFCGSCLGWNYYRKPASQINEENEGELFSDTESKLEMLQNIVRTRLLPLGVIFCCIVPNLRGFPRDSSSIAEYILLSFLTVMFFVYIYLFIHCGRKIRKLKKELSE